MTNGLRFKRTEATHRKRRPAGSMYNVPKITSLVYSPNSIIHSIPSTAHVCMCVYVCTYVYMCVYVCMYACVWLYVCIYVSSKTWWVQLKKKIDWNRHFPHFCRPWMFAHRGNWNAWHSLGNYRKDIFLTHHVLEECIYVCTENMDSLTQQNRCTYSQDSCLMYSTYNIYIYIYIYIFSLARYGVVE